MESFLNGYQVACDTYQDLLDLKVGDQFCVAGCGLNLDYIGQKVPSNFCSEHTDDTIYRIEQVFDSGLEIVDVFRPHRKMKWSGSLCVVFLMKVRSEDVTA